MAQKTSDQPGPPGERQNIVNEDAIRIGGPRKLFLEAKKPSVAIGEEISAAYQLRRSA